MQGRGAELEYLDRIDPSEKIMDLIQFEYNNQGGKSRSPKKDL